MSSFERTQRMPFYKVIQELGLQISTPCLSRALKKRGYSRSNVPLKSPGRSINSQEPEHLIGRNPNESHDRTSPFGD